MGGTPKEVLFLRLTVKRLRSYLQLARAEIEPDDFKCEDRFLRDTVGVGASRAKGDVVVTVEKDGVIVFHSHIFQKQIDLYL